MTCSRCGAEAAVKREAAFYCGKCAVARDWGEIISIVQADRHERATVSFDSAPEGEPATVGAGVESEGELPADPFA